MSGTTIAAAFTVTTIAALRGYSGIISPVCQVEGYYAGADGGGGVFWYNASDTTSADNGGTIIVDAAGRRWHRETAGTEYSVKWFGTKGDGTTDDTAAILATIAAAQAAGAGRVCFPLADYKISSILAIGNGGVGAVSTLPGVVLCGATLPMPGLFFSALPCATLTWAGGAVPMIRINGPIQGWGIQNFVLNGAGVATYGIEVVSGSLGDNANLYITQCITAQIGSTTVPTFGGSSNTDSIHNSWRNITVSIPSVTGAKGVLLTGETGGSSNTDYNEFTNLWVIFPPGGIQQGIYLQNCDTNAFRGVHLGGGSASAQGVVFDYTGTSLADWPSANSFFGIDSNGTVLGGNQFVNGGTPSSSARPNYIYGLNMANGGTNPNLANLTPSFPIADTPDVVLFGQTASISGTVITTPFAPGMYRVNLYLSVSTTGNNVVVTASFGWNDGSPVSVSTAAINFSTGANNPQTLTQTVYNVASEGITYSTTVSGAVGSGTYMLVIVVERIS